MERPPSHCSSQSHIGYKIQLYRLPILRPFVVHKSAMADTPRNVSRSPRLTLRRLRPLSESTMALVSPATPHTLPTCAQVARAKRMADPTSSQSVTLGSQDTETGAEELEHMLLTPRTMRNHGALDDYPLTSLKAARTRNWNSTT